MKYLTLPLAAICLAIGLSACSTQAPIERAQKNVEASTLRSNEVFGKTEVAKKEVVPVYKRVPGLWISDRFVPSNSVQELPAEFDRKFTLRERRPLTIGDVAEIIRARAGISVTLQGEQIVAAPFQVDHVGSLKSLIDSVTSRQGMTWEWRDGGLKIQQSDVKTFVVNRPGMGALKASSGGAGGGASGGRIDPFKDLVDAIKVVSPTARVSVLRASNALTVADRPANMQRIADLVELDLDNSDKQVLIHWQLVNVTSREGGEAGVNLNYILARSGGKFSFLTPQSLAGTNGGVIKFNKTSGNATGSEAALSLLNESGVAYVASENLEPVKHNTRRSFGTQKSITYRSESTPGVASSSTTSASVGIKQSTIKVGLTGEFGASIYDNESLDLLFDFNLEVLDALREDSSAGYSLQSPETTKRYAVGDEGVRMRHGNTYIISAEQTKDISFDRRGLLPGAASVLGGSERANEKRGLWLLLVTPIITNKGV